MGSTKSNGLEVVQMVGVISFWDKRNECFTPRSWHSPVCKNVFEIRDKFMLGVFPIFLVKGCMEPIITRGFKRMNVPKS